MNNIIVTFVLKEWSWCCVVLLHSVEGATAQCVAREAIRTCNREDMAVIFNGGMYNSLVSQYLLAMHFACNEYSDGNTGRINITYLCWLCLIAYIALYAHG